jgi:hypothetical protein
MHRYLSRKAVESDNELAELAYLLATLPVARLADGCFALAFSINTVILARNAMALTVPFQTLA